MREIKFRAWDKKNKYMSPIGTLCFGKWAEIYIPKQVSSDGDIEWDGGKVDLNDLEIMEFTGLKDKNGVDIYEGDILLGKWDLNDRKVKAVVEWTNCYCGFSPFDNYDSDCGDYWQTEQCEVIGNIYENPELLEQKGKGE